MADMTVGKQEASRRMMNDAAAESEEASRPSITVDDLNHAFDNGEFCFYLQPKCNAVTGSIVGMEALIRWNHPKYGMVLPGEFIPLLERERMITRFDFYIWNSVCKTLARWQREGRNMVPISINVSMVDIDAVDVARSLGNILNQYDLDARLLQVEITESAIAKNLEIVASTIHDLHSYGIAVLMDDFGSAYSSLNLLKDINVDAIKLDMKFIDLNDDNKAKGLRIVEAVVNMAYQLKIEVIAEGAQTAEQVKQLQALGCVYIQGYFFFKPLSVEEAERLLANRSDGHQFWNITRDIWQCDYRRPKGGSSVLESSSLAVHAFELLAKGAADLSRLNLMTGEYRAIKRDAVMPDRLIDDFSEYCRALIHARTIHPREASKFSEFMELSGLRDMVFREKRSIIAYFSSEVDAHSGILMVNILVPSECDEQQPWVTVLWELDPQLDMLNQDLEVGYRQDSLTGLLNRNAYDRDIRQTDVFKGKPLVCVYIDLIGLHEVNNHLGHKRGDRMLSDFANIIRARFGDDRIYRIGGDEFVLLSSSHTEEQTVKQLRRMRGELVEQGCELSIGVSSTQRVDDLPALVENAETAMRMEKKAYYAHGGGLRRSRILDEKLEGILTHSRDMEQLLSYLHIRYTTAMVVNMQTDRIRPIAVSTHFMNMLREHGGLFSKTLDDYCERSVVPQCRDSFRLLMDYDFVQARIASAGTAQYGYTQTDGRKILITVFPDSRDMHETIWVFSREDLPLVEKEVFDD